MHASAHAPHMSPRWPRIDFGGTSRFPPCPFPVLKGWRSARERVARGTVDLRAVEARPLRLLAAALRAAEVRAARRSGALQAAAPARAGRARSRPSLLRASRPPLRRRLRLLSARLLHDEVQPAPERAPGCPARLRRPAPASASRGLPGRARALLPSAGSPGGDLRSRRRHASTGGRLAGR